MGLRRVVRVLAALALVAVTMTVPSTGTAQDDGSRRTLTIVDQTTWVRADQPFDMRVRIDSHRPPRQLELAVTVFGRVPFRSQFARTIDGQLLGSVLSHQTVPVSEAARAADGTRMVSATPPLRRAGVYPVRVELRDTTAEDPLARLTTHLVHLPDTEYGAPLSVAPILPFDASPAITTDGEPRIPATRVEELTLLAAALDRHRPVAATLVPTPGTLDALAASADESDERAALTAISSAATRRSVLASSYVPVDLAALLRGGLEAEAEAQLARGRDTVERVIDREPSETTWIALAPPDATSIDWLRARGFDQFVIGDDALEPARLTTTLTAPFELAVPDGEGPLAVSIDPGLTAHFDASDQPVVAAHRLLADLAVIYFDHPGREGRGITVVPPRGWHPDPAFLEALLDGLETSPILSTSTIERFFDEVPPATDGRDALVRRIESEEESDLPVARIAAARQRLDSFGTLLADGNVRWFEFERLLFAAQDVDLPPGRRSAYLRGFHGAIEAELALVEIPDRQSIRLTARQGDIPIPILSRTGYPVRVRVQVEGDTLEFPHGGDRLVSLDNETTTERISVRARSSGAFPLRVRVLSPDGRLAVTASRLTVTSTAASWVGLVLSVGAAMFLIVWWARHIHGRRSGKLIPT